MTLAELLKRVVTAKCAHLWQPYNPEPYVTRYYCAYCKEVK